jgi:hypothetical protein
MGGMERLRPVRNERPLSAGIAIGRSTGVLLTLAERWADWGDECTTPDVPEREDSSGAEPLRVRDGSMWGLVEVELDCGGTYDVTSP